MSLFLFILGAEILATKIRQSKNVSGIHVYQHEFKISLFADDDTSLLCKDLLTVENAIIIINEFGVISGLRLNHSKTKALWLGPWRNSNATPFSFKWSKEPERALGIYISYDLEGNYKKNFTSKIDRLYNKLGFWRSRNLTLLDRSLIFKCLGIPQLVYSASIISNPRAKCSRQITSHLYNYIWNNKPDKIKREVIYSDYPEGMLRVPNIDIKFKSLKLAWIARLIRIRSSPESWRVIPDHYFIKYGGLNFLLRCNYDKKCLDQSGMPSFYKQILFEPDVGQDMILFNNKEIVIDGRTVCYNDWLEGNVIAVHDLLDKNSGKFLSYHQFKLKYNLNCNFLTFFPGHICNPKASPRES